MVLADWRGVCWLLLLPAGWMVPTWCPLMCCTRDGGTQVHCPSQGGWSCMSPVCHRRLHPGCRTLGCSSMQHACCSRAQLGQEGTDLEGGTDLLQGHIMHTINSIWTAVARFKYVCNGIAHQCSVIHRCICCIQVFTTVEAMRS